MRMANKYSSIALRIAVSPWYSMARDRLPTLEIFDYVDDGLRRIWSGNGKGWRTSCLSLSMEQDTFPRAYVLPSEVGGVGAPAPRGGITTSRTDSENRKKKARRKELIGQLKGWNRTNALRQIIEEVKKRSGSDAPAWPTDAVNRWLTWAEEWPANSTHSRTGISRQLFYATMPPRI